MLLGEYIIGEEQEEGEVENEGREWEGGVHSAS